MLSCVVCCRKLFDVFCCSMFVCCVSFLVVWCSFISCVVCSLVLVFVDGWLLCVVVCCCVMCVVGCG